MDVIIGLKGGYKVFCVNCMKKIKLSDAKIVKGKPLCNDCYIETKKTAT